VIVVKYRCIAGEKDNVTISALYVSDSHISSYSGRAGVVNFVLPRVKRGSPRLSGGKGGTISRNVLSTGCT
jgi:hypothetical protein